MAKRKAGDKKEKKVDPRIKAIAHHLKSLRVKAGYKSYEHFAIQHDISRMQYWRYEKGEDMRLSSFLNLLEALKVSPEAFFSEIDLNDIEHKKD